MYMEDIQCLIHDIDRLGIHKIFRKNRIMKCLITDEESFTYSRITFSPKTYTGSAYDWTANVIGKAMQTAFGIDIADNFLANRYVFIMKPCHGGEDFITASMHIHTFMSLAVAMFISDYSTIRNSWANQSYSAFIKLIHYMQEEGFIVYTDMRIYHEFHED